MASAATIQAQQMSLGKARAIDIARQKLVEIFGEKEVSRLSIDEIDELTDEL